MTNIANELVSFIMPVKGADPFQLRQSLKCIVSQTHDMIEVIIIFDEEGKALDLENLSVLEEFKDDLRVKVYKRKAGRGLCAALNDGLRLSKGLFIARMDSDDISLTTRVEEQLLFIKKTDLSVLGTWAYLINQIGQVIGQMTPPTKSSDIRRILMLHNPMIHSSILFPTKLVKEVGFFNPGLEGAEDYDFYIRCFAAGKQIGNLDKPLLYLRENSRSITRGKRMIESRIYYLKTKIDATINHGFRKPRDILYLCLSPAMFFIPPSRVKTMKYLLGWFSSPKR